MITTLIAAAIAATLAWPAAAADAPKAETRADKRTEKIEKHIERHEFTYDFDLGEVLAAADEARNEAQRAHVEAQHVVDWAHDFAAEMHGSMAYMFSDRVGRGKVVKGAPYSAEIVTERKQTLGDGNVITHGNTSRVYRDGEGRTRQEAWRDDKLRSFYIYDPAAAMAYTVLPDSKIAVALPRIERAAPRARIRVETGKTSGDDKKDGERRVIVRTIDGDNEPGVREEVRVQVIRIGDDVEKEVVIAPRAPRPPVPPAPPTPPMPPTPPTPAMPPMPPMPGVDTMRFESSVRLGKGTTTSLGTRDFEGVKAEGKQTTWTIPAGQVGNKSAINVTSESWYSPELQVTVYTRYNDPRTGESTYRLAKIKRGEPSADLFKVPEGYTVKGRGKREAPEAKSPG